MRRKDAVPHSTPSGKGLRFAVVAAKYNPSISKQLLEGALRALRKHGTKEKDITVFHVPGSFELPQLAGKAAATGKFDAIICVGTLIRGETLHFELISTECASGIQRVAAQYGIPVTFGVITADTMEQARVRAGKKSENKGWEAAIAAMEMATIYALLH